MIYEAILEGNVDFDYYKVDTLSNNIRSIRLDHMKMRLNMFKLRTWSRDSRYDLQGNWER